MSEDNHKRISRHALEMWGSNNKMRREEIFAENYINHQEPDVEGGISDKNMEEWKALVAGYHKSFSDANVRILMQIAEDDLAATHWEFTSTHHGEFMGLVPTGRIITWTGVQIDRFNDDKIVESWVSWDKYRFFSRAQPGEITLLLNQLPTESLEGGRIR